MLTQRNYFPVMGKPDYPSLLASKFTYELHDDSEQTAWEQYAQKNQLIAGSMNQN